MTRISTTRSHDAAHAHAHDHAHGDGACAQQCPIAEGMGRRLFMERSALAALGAMIAACGDGVFGTEPLMVNALPQGTSFQIRLSDFPSLTTVGAIATTSIAGVPLAIGHTSAGAYAIWSMVCPHQQNQVAPNGTGFKCPGHGAQWNGLGQWIGGQNTGNLTLIPSTYDAVNGMLMVDAASAPAVEQDFTIDLTQYPKLQTVDNWIAVTKPKPGTTTTTRIIIYNTPLDGYIAYGAACGHMGKYLSFNTQLGHWKCDEHHAEFDIYGKKLKDADDHPEVPTAASLVMLTTALNGTTLHVTGNSPAQGTNFG